MVDLFHPREPVSAYTVHAASLESLAPGEALGGVLAAVDPADLDMHDLVSFLGACERQTAWTQAPSCARYESWPGAA